MTRPRTPSVIGRWNNAPKVMMRETTLARSEGGARSVGAA